MVEEEEDVDPMRTGMMLTTSYWLYGVNVIDCSPAISYERVNE